MNKLYPLAIALMTSVMVFGCADESLVTSPSQETAVEARVGDAVANRSFPDFHDVMFDFSPDVTLAKSHNTAGTFTTPLFGLATAPNDDILVADAGSGIAFQEGATDIALPGVTAVAATGRSSIWATTAGLSPTENSGQALYRVSRGHQQLVANLFEFEETYDPDGPLNPPDGNVDSNPYDVASLKDQSVLVVDAGGNDLLRVDNQGNIDVLALFPNELVSTENIRNLIGCPTDDPLCDLPAQIPAQAVPTSVAVGPDGYYYVGELKGFPAPAGASNIWRVSPDASWAMCGSSPDCTKVFDGGFTSIIDLAFGSDGTLYVAELDEASWFALEVLGFGIGGTVNACNLSSATCSEVDAGINMLTAITVDRRGGIWATRNALVPGQAEVFQIQ